MAQLDDFSKIIHNGNEMGKVLHQGKTIWSSGFDGDFSNPELWELGTISGSTGQNFTSSYEARTKNFYKIPSSRLSVSMNTEFSGELFFYAEDNSFISRQSIYSTPATVPNGATYYKIVLYKGIGAQVQPMNIPVFVPEANIKVEGI